MRLRKKNVSRVAAVAMAAAMTVSMAAPAAVAATATEVTTNDVAAQAATDNKQTYITVYVSYEDENGNSVGGTTTIVTKSYDIGHKYSAYINTHELEIPNGYERSESGDGDIYLTFDATDTSVSYTVKVKSVAPATKTIYVEYQDEATGESVDFFELTVNADDTYANTSALKIPDGYEVCNDGDFYFGQNATATVKVRKVVKTRTVYVEYQDEDTKESVGFFELTVNADDTYANTSKLDNIPEGYELCETGDFYFGQNATATVKVRKAVKTRTVYVEYQDEATKESVGFFELTVNADDTYANTSKLDKIPEGYELCETGDFYFGKNATATVKVRKIAKADDSIATKPGNGTMEPNFGMGYHPIREFFRAVFRFLFGRH